MEDEENYNECAGCGFDMNPYALEDAINHAEKIENHLPALIECPKCKTVLTVWYQIKYVTRVAEQAEYSGTKFDR
jgi:hypothetical protein